jgi:uncharacterized surface protein with fasciclin (FAS1) repeats
VKTRAGKTVGLVAAATAIALSMGVTVTAHGDPAPEQPAPTTTSTTTTLQAPDPQGSGCDAYKSANPTGKGSFTGMSTETMSEAVANNPSLTTLNSALTGGFIPQVNLVSTIDSGQHILFAPTDDAFAQLPPEQLSALKTDPTALANVLNYHVVLGLLYPEDVHGKLTTMQGKQVTVTGKGGDVKVDDTAKVVCGGITTTTGVIYMIDTVLNPSNAIATSTTSTTSTTSETTTSTTPSETSPTTTTTTPPR